MFFVAKLTHRDYFECQVWLYSFWFLCHSKHDSTTHEFYLDTQGDDDDGAFVMSSSSDIMHNVNKSAKNEKQESYCNAIAQALNV